VITNLSQMARVGSADLPERYLVSSRLKGTVLMGGGWGSVVSFDGAPALSFLPAQTNALPLERGQRFLMTGDCLVDGTNLLLGPQPLVDNDGVHSMLEMSAGIWLDKGEQPIRVQYFNRGGDEGLAISMQGPQFAKEKIPDALLSHLETNRATGITEYRPGVVRAYYEGEWDLIPDFGLLPCLSSNITSNFEIDAAGKKEFFGMNFEGFVEIPRTGWYIFSSESDDGSLVFVGRQANEIHLEGKVALPPLPRLIAGQPMADGTEPFCCEMEGIVSFAGLESGAPTLELSSGCGRTLVQMRSGQGMNPQYLEGARVRAGGICESVFTPEGYHAAGKLTVLSPEHLTLLDVPDRLWSAQPLTSIQQIQARLRSNGKPFQTRVKAEVLDSSSNGWWWIGDGSGRLLLEDRKTPQLKSGMRVEALGVAGLTGTNALIRGGVFRRTDTLESTDKSQWPVLTTVEQVKQMSREEAKRNYPVRVRGVVTFVWPKSGFFLQDGTWSIDVRMDASATRKEPEIGDYWEVEGETFAEFAPDIRATKALRLGPGILPAVLHPNWNQLVDGSLDTQYIEVKGAVSSAEGNGFSMVTPGGQIRVQLPQIPASTLRQYAGAVVRVRGCLVPGRDVATQRVKLGEFSLMNAIIAVDVPAPADPFSLPIKHVTDLLLYDSHSSPIQRIKLQGTVLQERNGICYMMDRTNGIRILPQSTNELRPGEQFEVVGLPDLSGPSPLLRDALVRRTGFGPLPQAVPLETGKILDGQYDSTLVEAEAILASLRSSSTDQILEMRSGSRIWIARLPIRFGELPPLAVGSYLKIQGVYVGQGGDRAGKREIDSFELLLNSPADVFIVRQPSWWTVRHALAVSGALSAILLLSWVWIWSLRRQVEDQTIELKNEIEDHKCTELELEQKTEMLTRGIEERMRIEAEMERGHKQLLITSRLAGMAEVATSVLHNVGNVMTSVNVLSSSITDLVRNSKISGVARLADLLNHHKNELADFVAKDDRGRRMPDFVANLGTHLAAEQSVLLEKVRVLSENIQHINEIVAMQQTYASVSGVLETVPPEEVVEDALRMHGESLNRHGIALARDFAKIPAITMDRHKVLQILFNLLENAKYACLQADPPERKIVVSLKQPVPEFIQLVVSDNGMGIPPENLARIFDQGFSTRKDGHGFGLHSSILTAQDMGGGLVAYSEGAGRGATFVLEVPIAPKRETDLKRGRETGHRNV
jgi:signal transduction histidine kinase